MAFACSNSMKDKFISIKLTKKKKKKEYLIFACERNKIVSKGL